VIHAAATAALEAGATVHGVLDVCRALADEVPVVLLVYANIVLRAGVAGFALRAANAGAAGLIVPDLPFDEADELREACDAEGLDLVPLVAPTTRDERIAQIGAGARGFVYAVSATLERVRRASRVPVAVGFGISGPRQADRAADLADGVIVGSRIVRAAGEGGPDAVGEAVAELARAVR
jgi:tryptophan synthase alpha chain